jgi:hypothetical protein
MCFSLPHSHQGQFLVLTRLFFFFDVRRTVPYFYVLQKRVFRACVKTRNSFPAHHGGWRLWPLPSPMARRHPNQAHRRHPHTMGDAACAWFGLNPLGGRVVSIPPPQRNYVFFFMHARCCYFVEYIHIFDTLLINYVPKFPPRLCSKRRCCCRPPPSRQPLPPHCPAADVVVIARQRRRGWITTHRR